MRGSTDRDRQRYADLMAYMEEKRIEAKEQQKEEGARKLCARRKEESWALLRMSIAYLRKNEMGTA